MKQFNDQQIITDVLAGQKELAKLYMNAIIESSCSKMRSVIMPIHNEVAENQFKCFQYMQARNLYPVDYAQPQQLTEAINKFASL